MGRHSLQQWGAGLAVLGFGLVGTVARAEEPRLQARVSVLTSQESLGPTWDFTPWVNLGATLRSRGDEDSGWLFGAQLSVNAGMAAEPNRWAGSSTQVRDNGSAFFARYRPEGWGPGEDASLTVYPLDGSRLRLGWAYPATWAGNYHGRWESTPELRLSSVALERKSTHGIQLQVKREGWHAFAALKTNEWTQALAPMAGAGISLPLSLRAEVQAAYVPRQRRYPGLLRPDTSQLDPDGAQLPEPPQGNGSNAPPHTRGVSARLVHARGAPIGTNVDFGLYGTAPTLFEDAFRPETYSEGVAHGVSLEATHTVLHGVADLGVINGGQYWVPRSTHTNMLALDARFRWNRLRLHGLGLVRSAGAVVQEDADLWMDFFRGSRRRPELGLSLGADYHLASAGLTPGLGLRVLSPAGILRADGADEGAPASWWHLSSEGLARVLPNGQEPRPLVSARATVKWDLLRWVAAAGELSYTWERHAFAPKANPALGYAINVGELVSYHTKPPSQGGLGFNLLVQARY